ncbi:methyl-accepting chemotaxis protein, partial [Mesorhizobium sp. M00.F.Ca.ET.186.01.1.1]
MNKSLASRVVALMAVIVVLTMAVNVFMINQNSATTIERTLSRSSIGTAMHVAAGIDTEKLASFLAKPEKNDEYMSIQKTLKEYMDKTGALYVYILQADGEKVKIMADGMVEDSFTIGQPTTSTTFADIAPVIQGGTSN